jgi:hypothetical protein
MTWDVAYEGEQCGHCGTPQLAGTEVLVILLPQLARPRRIRCRHCAPLYYGAAAVVDVVDERLKELERAEQTLTRERDEAREQLRKIGRKAFWAAQ